MWIGSEGLLSTAIQIAVSVTRCDTGRIKIETRPYGVGLQSVGDGDTN